MLNLENRIEIERAVMNNDYNAFLKPDQEITDLMNNDEFWDSLKDDREIPLEWAIGRDKTFPIVGKEKEIAFGKIAAVKQAKLELMRRSRRLDLSSLLTEWEYLKTTKISGEMSRWDKELKKLPGYDWENSYKIILTGLNKNTKLKDLKKDDPNYESIQRIVNERRRSVQREDITKRILLNISEYAFKLKINESRITEKLREEFPTPITYLLVGPMGSGKSIIQRRVDLSREDLYNILGLNGYDRLMLRDQEERHNSFLRTFLGGEGSQVLEYYKHTERTKRKWAKIRNWTVYGSLFAFPLYAASILTSRIAQIEWGLNIGVDPAIDIGVAFNDNFRWIASAGAIALINTGWIVFKNWFTKGESNMPEWIVDSTSSTAVMTSNLDKYEILGRYESESHQSLPPQSKFSTPIWLSADGGCLTIEQIADLNAEAQNILAQMIQEKEYPIANMGKYVTDFFPMYSMGLNPHLAHKVVAPLKDRLKLGYSSMVVNEIPSIKQGNDNVYDSVIEQFLLEDPNSPIIASTDESSFKRSKYIERKFWAFLKFARKDNKYLLRDAWEKALELSSALAEDKSKLVIDRDLVGITNLALTLSTLKERDYTSAEDFLNSAKVYRSDEQRALLPILESHYKSFDGKIEAGIGIVNILGLLPEKRKSMDDIHERDIAEHNSLGYVFPIKATVKNAEDKESQGSLEIITDRNLEHLKSFYKQELMVLLENKGVNCRGYDIKLDLSKALFEDDAMLAGMYVSVISAINKEELSKDKTLLASCDHYGNLLEPKKPNKRIITARGRLNTVVISSDDEKKRVDKRFYKNDFKLDVIGLKELDAVYGAMKK